MTEDEQGRLMGNSAAELAKLRKEGTCLAAKASQFVGILISAGDYANMAEARRHSPDSAMWTNHQADG